MGEETQRAELHGLAEAAHGLVGLPASGGQEAKALVRQGAAGGQFLGLPVVRLGGVQPANVEEFVAQAIADLHRGQAAGDERPVLGEGGAQCEFEGDEFLARQVAAELSLHGRRESCERRW